MIETLGSIFAVIGGLYTFWRWVRKTTTDSSQQLVQSQASEVYALVERFVQIYKAHGIERTQISRFLGEESGLTLADVRDDEKLLHALNEKLLQTTCSRFGIQREWLDGKDVSIYPYRHYDKNLKGFIDFLEYLNAEYDEVEGFAIKCEKDKLKKSDERYPIVFVFRGKLDHWGAPGEESIWRHYPFCDEYYWGYDRTRFEIKAMALATWQFDIHMGGCELPQEIVEGIIGGQIFPGPLFDHLYRGAWHPDDYIFAKGESACAKDIPEAKKMYDEMERLGWLEYLIEKTGPVPRPIFGRREASS